MKRMTWIFIVGIFSFLAHPARVSAAMHGSHTATVEVPYDINYIDMMIAHHEQGLQMANLAATKAESESVRAIASKMIGEQNQDIAELKQRRGEWFPQAPAADAGTMVRNLEKSARTKGMKMDPNETTEKLQGTSGKEFDKNFLSQMINHHKLAIKMSDEAVNKAEHSELKDFAKRLRDQQKSETKEMSRIRSSID